MSRPDILWLTLESVRADHTSLCGYDRPTTPRTRAFAERSDATVFQNCFAHSIWTPASSASILTGRYMSDHHVGREGTGERSLPTDLPTLPERLADSGYRTACLSPNPFLSEANGLDRGFEDFYWVSTSNWSAVGVRPVLNYLRRVRSVGPGLTLDTRRHNFSYMLAERGRQWLSRAGRDDAPFFMYAHVGNPHHAYTPPRRWQDRFLGDGDLSVEAALAASVDTYRSTERLNQVVAEGIPLDERELDAIEALYDAEIAYADYCLDRLISRAEAVSDDLVVVVTADHGELFGERGMLGHNVVLDDAVTHVPLVVAGLDGTDDRASELVQHADVTNTVAAAAGVDADFRGVDLRESSRDYCVVQRGTAHLDAYRKHDPSFDTDRYHRHPVTAVRTEEFAFAKSDDLRVLRAVPEGTVVTDRLDAVDDLEPLADEYQQWERRPTAEAAFTDGMEDQLADLGYR